MSDEELVVSEDVALADFERMADARHLSTDESKMNEFQKVVYLKYKELFCKYVSEGCVTVGEGELVTFTPRFSKRDKPFRFKGVTQNTFVCGDKQKTSGENAYYAAMLAQLCGENQAVFSELHQRDWAVMKDLMNVFLD